MPDRLRSLPKPETLQIRKIEAEKMGPAPGQDTKKHKKGPWAGAGRETAEPGAPGALRKTPGAEKRQESSRAGPGAGFRQFWAWRARKNRQKNSTKFLRFHALILVNRPPRGRRRDFAASLLPLFVFRFPKSRPGPKWPSLA